MYLNLDVVLHSSQPAERRTYFLAVQIAQMVKLDPGELTSAFGDDSFVSPIVT